MPKKRSRPAYQLHKATGQAKVRIDGKDHYLGAYGSPDSRDEYERLVSAWFAKQDIGRFRLTVDDLALLYLEHAQQYYRKRGRVTSEVSGIRIALRHLIARHGRTRLRDFGPLALKEVWQAMIQAGYVRKSINIHIGRIRRMFKWGVAEQLVPADVLTALQALDGLREGRAKVRESEPVRPVFEAAVAAVKPYVSRPIWAMVQVQLFTGMRPGEVMVIRGCDLNMAGRAWEYTPAEHKTEHHHKGRTIYIGPRAQAVIREFLKPDLQAFLFCPKDGRAEFVQENYRDDAKRNGTGHRTPGDRYTVHTYQKAIERACEKAFGMPAELRNPRRGLKKLPEDQREAELDRRKREATEWRQQHCWHPHQLRHSAATSIRREADLDTARTVLGHSSLNVAEIYAERDLETARRIIERIG